MKLSQLHRKSLLFSKIADTSFDIFGTGLLDFIIKSSTGKPTREELDSYIRTNHNLLSEMRKIRWQGATKDGLYGVMPQLGHYALLSKTSTPPKSDVHYKMKSASMLKGTKSIPTLYLFTMIEEEETKEIEYPSATTGYEFVAEALIEIFELRNDTSHPSLWMADIMDYIKTNKSALDKLRSRFNSMPRRLGAGSDGVVFNIGHSRVLKIFKDRTAYEAAKSAMHRIFTGKEMGATEVLVDDVGELGTFDSLPVYYYTMEKVLPLTNTLDIFEEAEVEQLLETIKQMMQVYRSTLEKLRSMPDHPKMMHYVRGLVDKISKHIKRMYSGEIAKIDDAFANNAGKLREDWLERLIEDMMVKYLTNRTDLATRNLGITNGLLKFYDAAFMEHPRGRDDMIGVE